MSARGPRLEFAVGAFLLLALASLLVLAIASTNGKFGFGDDSYELKARFTNLGQLRPMAPTATSRRGPRALMMGIPWLKACVWGTGVRNARRASRSPEQEG